MRDSSFSTSCASAKRKRIEEYTPSKRQCTESGAIKSTTTVKDLPTELQQDIISRILDPYFHKALALENVPIVPKSVFNVLDPDDYIHRLKGTLISIDFMALYARKPELMVYPYEALQARTKREQARLMRKMATFVETAKQIAVGNKMTQPGRHREILKWYGFKLQPLEWTYLRLNWLSGTLMLMQGELSDRIS